MIETGASLVAQEVEGFRSPKWAQMKANVAEMSVASDIVGGFMLVLLVKQMLSILSFSFI